MGHGAMKVNNASIVLNTVCTLKTFTDYFDRFFYTVKLDFKELFTDYQLFHTINLLLNKELLLI